MSRIESKVTFFGSSTLQDMPLGQESENSARARSLDAAAVSMAVPACLLPGPSISLHCGTASSSYPATKHDFEVHFEFQDRLCKQQQLRALASAETSVPEYRPAAARALRFTAERLRFSWVVPPTNASGRGRKAGDFAHDTLRGATCPPPSTLAPLRRLRERDICRLCTRYPGLRSSRSQPTETGEITCPWLALAARVVPRSIDATVCAASSLRLFGPSGASGHVPSRSCGVSWRRCLTRRRSRCIRPCARRGSKASNGYTPSPINLSVDAPLPFPASVRSPVSSPPHLAQHSADWWYPKPAGLWIR